MPVAEGVKALLLAELKASETLGIGLPLPSSSVAVTVGVVPSVMLVPTLLPSVTRVPLTVMVVRPSMEAGGAAAIGGGNDFNRAVAEVGAAGRVGRGCRTVGIG
jgi:hypothetical protein